MTRGLRLLVVLGLAFTQASDAVETVRWERLPLSVQLRVGEERVLFIDRAVRVGVPANAAEQLQVQSAGGALYLRAQAPLPTTRIELQDIASGALILLDVIAESPAPGEKPFEPLRIVDATRSDRFVSEDADASSQASSAAEDEQRHTPIAVALTRYAAQSLYAPLRTVEPIPGIIAVPLRRQVPLDTLLPTMPMVATALVAWRLRDHWVTAVKLTHTARQWIDLDPRLLQGNFVAATFQHRTLGSAGDSTDTTVVYLITRGHDIGGSLLPEVTAFDAALNVPSPSARKPAYEK